MNFLREKWSKKKEKERDKSKKAISGGSKKDDSAVYIRYIQTTVCGRKLWSFVDCKGMPVVLWMALRVTGWLPVE